MKQNEKPYANVIGLDCIQGLQSARILAERKVPVILHSREDAERAAG